MKMIIIFLTMIMFITFVNADVNTADVVDSNDNGNSIMTYGLIIVAMSVAFIVTTVMRGIKKK